MSARACPAERPADGIVGEEEGAAQVARLGEFRAARDQPAVDAALAAVEAAASGSDNLLPPMREALRARATLGEVSDALRRVPPSG